MPTSSGWCGSNVSPISDFHFPRSPLWATPTIIRKKPFVPSMPNWRHHRTVQRARVELGMILETSAPTDLPPEFVPPDAVAKLSNADRSLVIVLTRVLGPQGLRTYADLLANALPNPRSSHSTTYGTMPTSRPANRSPNISSLHPRPACSASRTTRVSGRRSESCRFADETIAEAIAELYNTAQLDVLRRTRK